MAFYWGKHLQPSAPPCFLFCDFWMLSSTLLGCHSLLPLWIPCCINHLQNTACVKPLAHSSDSATDYSNCSLSFWQLNASTLPTTLWSSLLPLSQAGREEPLLNFLVMPVALLLVHSWWPRWMMCPLGLYLESSPGSSSLLKYIHSSILTSLNLFVPASAIFQGAWAFLLYWGLLLFFSGFYVPLLHKVCPSLDVGLD